MRTGTTAVVALLGLALLAPERAAGQAAGNDARLREALRAATVKAQALEGEKAAWQATEAQLRRELEAARAGLAEAQKAAGRSQASAGQARRAAEQSEAAASAAAAVVQCEASAAEATRLAAQERDRLAADSAASGQRAGRCEASREKTFAVAREILDWLDRLGFGAALAAREPFLGLKRVELENAAQDYRDKLLDARAEPGGTP